MGDERRSPQALAVVPFLGRRWVIPHSLLALLSVALPFIDPDVWDWTTAAGAGGFFGAMVALDLLAVSQQGNPQSVPALLPGEPQPKRRVSPLWWLAVALLLVSVLTLLYVGLGRPI